MTVKVVYTTHQTGFNIMGGAEVQMLNTQRHVNQIAPEKVQIQLFNPWQDKLEDFQILHLFNPQAFPDEALRIAQYARNKGLKIFVSTIFHDYQVIEKNPLKRISNTIIQGISRGKRFLCTFPSGLYEDRYTRLERVLLLADKILPNTELEKKQLLNRFPGLNSDKFRVVPNATHRRFEEGDPELFRDKYELEDYILFVGRVEKRKNVLGLIRAFIQSNLPTKLVILGSLAEESYYQECKSAANERVIFLPALDNNSELLRSAYHGAKVFALPSYYETPGIAALEAGLAGCNVMITEVGGTREYFSDKAWYVDPENLESIKKALISAYNMPQTRELSQHIAKYYTWEHVAKQMFQLYEEL